jgi:diguanylate cyclase (GGDEF)-like protein
MKTAHQQSAEGTGTLPEHLTERLVSCRTLPSVPAVVLDILELCRREDVEIPEISQVLVRDPALTAKILKAANSPLFGVRGQVATIDRAVSLLGINAALSVALSFSCLSALRRNRGPHFEHHAYWRRSGIAAVAAREFGARVDHAHRDEVFLAGLLQDLGMLVFNQAVTEEYDPLMEAAGKNHERLCTLEIEAFGADHAAVGAWLLDRWNFPDSLRLPIRGSHDPAIIEDAKHMTAAACVALAGRLAEIWSNPDMAGATARALELFVNLTQAPHEHFDTLLGDITKAIPAATDNLDIDIGQEEGLWALLEDAREVLVSLNLKSQQQTREVEERSRKDPLTSVFNRSHLDEILQRSFDSAKRSRRPLSVLFLDLDHFKSFNDTYGHHVGDMVLAAVGQLLGASLRSADSAARYGGEEFVCLLRNTDREGARLVGERLRSAIEKQPIPIPSAQTIHVTVSVGGATMSAQDQFASVGELINAADRCLYSAKAAGRNCLVI